MSEFERFCKLPYGKELVDKYIVAYRTDNEDDLQDSGIAIECKCRRYNLNANRIYFTLDKMARSN